MDNRTIGTVEDSIHIWSIYALCIRNASTYT